MRRGPVTREQVSHPIGTASHVESYVPAATVLSVIEVHDKVPGSVKLASRPVALELVLKETILHPV